MSTQSKLKSQFNQYNILKKEESIIFITFPSQKDDLLQELIQLMSKNLSEPYPIFTYRYFIESYPDLCIVAMDVSNKEAPIFIGGIIGSIEKKNEEVWKGYIGMIAVKDEYRGRGIAKTIVELFIKRVKEGYSLVEEIYLETEIDNIPALSLYESVGFRRTRMNNNYYMNGNSSYKLKMWLTK